MAKIFNSTPHPINIYGMDQVKHDKKTRKFYLKSRDEKPRVIIPSSDILLNAKQDYIKINELEGIEIFDLKILDCDKIPSKYDVVIVSAMFAMSAEKIGLEGVEKLYTISRPVYLDQENPRPVGCLGLNKYKA